MTPIVADAGHCCQFSGALRHSCPLLALAADMQGAIICVLVACQRMLHDTVSPNTTARQAKMSERQAVELRYERERKTLVVEFDNGESFELPAEYLRTDRKSTRLNSSHVAIWYAG